MREHVFTQQLVCDLKEILHGQRRDRLLSDVTASEIFQICYCGATQVSMRLEPALDDLANRGAGNLSRWKSVEFNLREFFVPPLFGHPHRPEGLAKTVELAVNLATDLDAITNGPVSVDPLRNVRLPAAFSFLSPVGFHSLGGEDLDLAIRR
ncbi:hypothetical protein [Pikeienuella piscinae]|uniref:hypothetical protein n=1 Tax=Pikeienuella piscinae TaxID=2748098 RepID=UPI001FEA852B|nr:hypothetical protein [Pikeienuella piscinae]